MKLSKVILTGAVGVVSLSMAACGGGSSSGEASGGGGEQTVFKLAFNQTEEHPQYHAGEELGKRLEEATDGRYSIKVYPNEQLGGQSDVIQNLANGTVELMWVGGPVLESYNEDFVVYNLPYVFDSYESQMAILQDEELNDDLFHSIEDKGITVLAGVHAGIRNIYNSKRPVTTPDDMAGLKIRVQQSDSQVKMIELMGGVASPMNLGEVYSALQTGVLDGAENNEPTYDAIKHDEVAKYYSYTKHLMIPDYLLVSTKALEGMDEADREAFLALIPEIQELASSEFLDYAEESKQHAEELGAQFNDADTAAFKEKLTPMVEEYMSANEARQTIYAAIKEANQANPA